MSKVPFTYNNKYRLIYMPEHPRCINVGGGNDGYIYEHRLVAEEILGRPLEKNEVVHHLDGNRGNNRHENLLIMTRGEHTKLHMWLRKGAPGVEQFKKEGWGEGDDRERYEHCKVCGKALQGNQRITCSDVCSHIQLRRAERPTKEELHKLVWETPTYEVGKMYGVSDKAVEKWCKTLGVEKPPRGYWAKKAAGKLPSSPLPS